MKLIFFGSFIAIVFAVIFRDIDCARANLKVDESQPEQKSHVAFLGQDESNEYDQLTDEESTQRLTKLIKTKVDLDNDEIVTEEELNKWILHISQLSKEIEVNRTFAMYSNSSSIDYDVYFNKTFGLFKNESLNDILLENLKNLEIHDNRKWKIADENKDNKLDRSEFLVFIHPEDYPIMKSVVIQEALDISDKNNDGYLDLEEYISYIWSPLKGSEKPDETMINIEHDTFKNHRDFNKDGKMDKEEILEWLMPSNYDASKSEVQHLMHYADINKDRKLSLDEIIKAHRIFAGSMVTNYGGSLKHEEL